MPAIDPTYEPRPWRCEECRQILGFVLRDANRVRRLWVLRIQLGSAATLPEGAAVITCAKDINHKLLSRWRVRAMDSGDVDCDHCGSIQEWHTSEESLVDLIRKCKGEAGVRMYKNLAKGNDHVAGSRGCQDDNGLYPYPSPWRSGGRRFSVG